MNILIIGDLHEPFTKEGYLEFCKETQDRFRCDKIIQIGDILDNHANSYHEVNPDGFSPKDELFFSKQKLKNWYQVFPNMEIILGNHDRLIRRKLFTAGISSTWIKDYSEVLETPKWNFHINYEMFNILFIHGEGGKVMPKVLNRRKSIVQGHYHTLSSIEFNVSDKDIIFGMQVGCGISDSAYAFEYAKDFTKKPILSCGVILDNGKIPLIVPMPL